METTTRKKRKAFVDEKFCVACGSCVKVCPMSAIQVYNGIMAKVNLEKCVGCGKCAKECPASVITVKEELSILSEEVKVNEKEMV